MASQSSRTKPPTLTPRRLPKALKNFLLLACLAHGLAAQNLTKQEEVQEVRDLIEEGRKLVRATEFDQALHHIEQALVKSRELGDRQLEFEATMAMSFTLGESGAKSRRVQWAQNALEIYEELGLIDFEAQTLYDLARAHDVVGNHMQAQILMDEAELLFRESGDTFGLAQIDSNLSLKKVWSGHHDEAIDHGRRALAALETLPQNSGTTALTLRALSSVAYALHKRGDLKPALSEYDRLIELAWTVNDQQRINFGYCNRAEIRWLLGEERPAQDDLWQAIEGWEKARSRILGTGDQKAEFLSRQVLAYDRLIRFLVDTSRGKEAFDVAERFHARSFLELLDEETFQSLGALAPKLWTHRQQLLDRLGQARLELEKDPEKEEEKKRQLEDLEGELQEVETRLIWQKSEPGKLPLRTPPPKLRQVQAGLNKGEVLISYWLTEDRAFAWAVFQKSIHFVQIPVSREKLTHEIQDYLDLLRSPQRAKDAALRGSEVAHIETGQRLYRWLIGSLPTETTQAQRMMIVPDGVLNYLPFEALVSGCDEEQASEVEEIHGSYRTCNYLGLDRPLAYSPSAGTFLRLRERHRQRPKTEQKFNLLAMAPNFKNTEGLELPVEKLRNTLKGRTPLVYAREEVERIVELFDRSSLRLDELATENRLKKEAGPYRYLHLATHGLVSDDLPMSSGILLGEGDGEDGLLQAHEVLNLELSADLVTLSACRTGRGLLRGGEGVVGLSRSFLTAGASAVVVSLWDVDDRSTPHLMETFYRKLAQGVPAPEAMLSARRRLFQESTEAKLVFKTRPMSYAHPRFWASFVLIGGI